MVISNAPLLKIPGRRSKLDLPFDESNFLQLYGTDAQEQRFHGALDSKWQVFMGPQGPFGMFHVKIVHMSRK